VDGAARRHAHAHARTDQDTAGAQRHCDAHPDAHANAAAFADPYPDAHAHTLANLAAISRAGNEYPSSHRDKRPLPLTGIEVFFL
jgi:hypothetical protein